MFVNIYWKRMLVWSGQNVIEGRIPLPDFDQGTVDKTIYNTRGSVCDCIMKYIAEILSTFVEFAGSIYFIFS